MAAKSKLASALFVALAANYSGHATAADYEIGTEYQINATYTDDGLNDKKLGKQLKATSFNLKGAKVAFRSKLSDQISWNVLYKLKEGELERFYLTQQVTDDLTVTVGKQKIKVYGLHRKLSSSTTTPVVAAYLDSNPLKDKLALDVSYKLAGVLSLQIVEDYSKCSEKSTLVNNPTTQAVTSTSTTTCSSWNSGSASGIVTNSKETQTKQKQPAVAFEWTSDIVGFSPLLQYSIYDFGKSNTLSAGLRYKKEGLDAYLDFTVDTRNAKGKDPADTSKFVSEKTSYKGTVAYLEYKLAGFTPYVHLSQFDTKPFVAEAATEIEKVVLENNVQGSLDKNGRVVSVGTHLDGFGNFYRPFISSTLSSGKFVDPEDGSKKKNLAKLELTTGVIGKF